MTWPNYSLACRKEVNEILKEGGTLSAYRASSAFPKWIGPKVGSQAYALEQEVAQRFKVKYAVAVNSGTAALHCALVSALGKPKSGANQVITSPYTFSATASAILLAGYEPVFADVDHYTFCITKETVKRVITKKTAAILPVSLFGYFPDYSDIHSLGYPVVIDHCQAVGSRRDGAYYDHRAASMAYSFNGGKNLPTGEGGCLVTNDSKIAAAARLLANHQENFGSQEVGYNYRMHEVVACIARHGLKDLDERNQRRRDLAHIALGWGPAKRESEHVYYVAPCVVRNRQLFIQRMSRHGVPVQAGYTQPLHTLPAFRKYQTKPLPVVEEVHKKLCLLTTLTPDKPLSYAKKVAGAIRESLA